MSTLIHKIREWSGLEINWVRPKMHLLLLCILLICVAIALNTGSYRVDIHSVFQWLKALTLGGNTTLTETEFVVIHNLRMPRILIGICVGGGLAISGAALQGLFRNPLVAPGLIGVSTGASLFAVIAIVLSSFFPSYITAYLGEYLISVFSFVGALLVVSLVYVFSQVNGKTDTALLLLAGVGFNALFGAVVGLVIFFADDAQLRSFTFWSLGDLGGAQWKHFPLVLIFIVLPSLQIMRLARHFDAMALGEATAFHIGSKVDKLKKQIIILTALIVGTSVAITGSIGFIGLVIPHIIRSAFGPNHTFLMPASFMVGGSLLILSDSIARVLITPAVLSIGIVTSLIGAPFFIYLLYQFKQYRRI